MRIKKSGEQASPAQDTAAAGGFFRTTRRTAITAMAAAGVAPKLFAQQGVHILIPGRERQYPVAVAPFRGEGQSPQPVSAIVLADLDRSGYFHSIPATDAHLDETSRPDLENWRGRGASWLSAGSVSRQSDGRYDVRFRLWDVSRGTDMGGQSYVVQAADLRLASHRVADFIYQHITGQPGIFSTRIAYITKSNRYMLWVADADGQDAQAALTSPQPIISPAWAPNGQDLAYVSFELGKPVIYIHNVASGKRRILANFRGSNSAPSWSPDGQRLAVTLTKDGTSQIYTMSAAGGQPTRLMSNTSIDTEPTYSPDGKSIYFVSDRGGSPQIYRVGVNGGAAQRITFNSNYNISPTLSPDGNYLAYISRENGGYRLIVMALATGQSQNITDTTDDKSPSFAPNSQLIIYTTTMGGSSALMTTTVDGTVKARLPAQPGDVREPAWGPLAR